MTVKLGEPRGDQSIINFGPVLRSDKQARYELFRVHIERLPDGRIDLGQTEMLSYMQGAIPRKGRLRLALPYGERFLIIARGMEKAGQVTSAEHALTAPFFVTIDAPQNPMPAARERAERARLSKKNAVSRAVHGVLARFR